MREGHVGCLQVPADRCGALCAAVAAFPRQPGRRL